MEKNEKRKCVYFMGEEASNFLTDPEWYADERGVDVSKYNMDDPEDVQKLMDECGVFYDYEERMFTEEERAIFEDGINFALGSEDYYGFVVA